MHFDQLAPLADAGNAAFVSLQTGEAARAAEAPSGAMRLLNATPDLTDFADTAAAMSQLDLIISVDTSTAHLAGALGRPVWTLLPFAPDWRWMLGRSDTPWYPNMRLFRQPVRCAWDAVIRRVAHELTIFLDTRRKLRDAG